ncbi:MAG: hypothetical protein ACI4TC_07465 [Kiritimatiellia bacterium]
MLFVPNNKLSQISGGQFSLFGGIDIDVETKVFRPNAKYTFRLLLPRLKRSPVRDTLIAAIYGGFCSKP